MFLKNMCDSLLQRLENSLKLSYQRISSVIDIFRCMLIDQHFYEKENQIFALLATTKGFTLRDTVVKDKASAKEQSKETNTEMDFYKTALLDFEKGRRIWCDCTQKFSIKIQETVLKNILTQD